jgi:uncharacterized protein
MFAQDETVYGPGWANPQMNIAPYLDDYPDLPLLMATSWYGHHHAATMRKLEAFAHHVTPKKLIIGPWIHTTPYGEFSLIGDVDVGPDAALNIDEIRLRWFDAYLRGIDPERMEESPAVTYYLIGGGSAAATSRATSTTEGMARILGVAARLTDSGAAGVHRRTATRPRRPAPRRTGRDPGNLANPVPTIGGSIRDASPMAGLMRDGAQDQRELLGSLRSSGSGLPLAARPDVAAFRSDPLAEPADLTGPVYIDLWLRSESPSCDLSVKLIDEYPRSADWPNGYAMNLSEIYTRFATWTRPASRARRPAASTCGSVRSTSPTSSAPATESALTSPTPTPPDTTRTPKPCPASGSRSARSAPMVRARCPPRPGRGSASPTTPQPAGGRRPVRRHTEKGPHP